MTAEISGFVPQLSSDRNLYQCQWENCNLILNSSEELKDHLEDHIGRGLSAYTCKWEGCTFGERKKRDHMKSHIRKHHQFVGFFCNVCKGGFVRDQDLRKHICQVESKSSPNTNGNSTSNINSTLKPTPNHLPNSKFPSNFQQQVQQQQLPTSYNSPSYSSSPSSPSSSFSSFSPSPSLITSDSEDNYPSPPHSTSPDNSKSYFQRTPEPFSSDSSSFDDHYVPSILSSDYDRDNEFYPSVPSFSDIDNETPISYSSDYSSQYELPNNHNSNKRSYTEDNEDSYEREISRWLNTAELEQDQHQNDSIFTLDLLQNMNTLMTTLENPYAFERLAPQISNCSSFFKRVKVSIEEFELPDDYELEQIFDTRKPDYFEPSGYISQKQSSKPFIEEEPVTQTILSQKNTPTFTKNARGHQVGKGDDSLQSITSSFGALSVNGKQQTKSVPQPKRRTVKDYLEHLNTLLLLAQ